MAKALVALNYLAAVRRPQVICKASLRSCDPAGVPERGSPSDVRRRGQQLPLRCTNFAEFRRVDALNSSRQDLPAIQSNRHA
jgi:hypothetical protein